MAHDNIFHLPPSIVSVADLKRLKRELEAINEQLLQATIRQETVEINTSKISQALADLTDLNSSNLLLKDQRAILNTNLDQLIKHASVLHISFASMPSEEFLDELIVKIRQSFGPYTLIDIGLAPAIGAGCLVRTTNRYFDLSLKQALMAKKDNLIKYLADVPDPTAIKKQAVDQAETAVKEALA
jgi:F0F1-type ATP synthase delta subunit